MIPKAIRDTIREALEISRNMCDWEPSMSPFEQEQTIRACTDAIAWLDKQLVAKDHLPSRLIELLGAQYAAVEWSDEDSNADRYYRGWVDGHRTAREEAQDVD